MWDYTIKDYTVDQNNELHYTCVLSHPDGRKQECSGNTNDPDNIRSVVGDLIGKLNQIDDLKSKVETFVASNLKGQKLPDPVIDTPIFTAEEIENTKLYELELLKRKVAVNLADQSDLDAAVLDAKAAIEEAVKP